MVIYHTFKFREGRRIHIIYPEKNTSKTRTLSTAQRGSADMFMILFCIEGKLGRRLGFSFMQSERLKVIVYLLFCTGSWAGGSVSPRVRFHWEAGPEAKLPRCKLRITLSFVLHDVMFSCFSKKTGFRFRAF